MRYFLCLCLTILAFSWIGSKAANAQTFSLNGVTFDQSAYFEEAELQATVAPYVGRPITFQDLSDMIAALQAKYQAAGIVTAQPILPPQTLDNGILHIALVEATIDTVEVDGLERTSPEFLRRTIALVPGEQPDFEQIERDLRIYELTHDIAPQIGFRPGATQGTTTAIISGEEPQPFKLTFSLDNFGRKETGRERATVFGRWASVTGLRDTLTFSLQGAEDANSVSLGYSRPVGSAGGRLVFGASYSDASVLTAPVSGVTVLSKTHSGSIGYRQPFAVTPTSAWFFNTNVQAERSESRVDGVTFSDVELYDLFVGVSYQLREIGRSLSFDVGLRMGDADAFGNSSTEGRYNILSLGGAFAQQVTSDLVLEGSLRGQLAPGENLPVARLFGAGGTNSVRGYPENVVSGDSGLQLRVQLVKSTPYRIPGAGNLGVKPFVFYDGAFVRPYRVAGATLPKDEVLHSAGIGMRVNYRKNLTGLMMMAVPLTNTQTFKDKHDPKFYFGLDYSF